MKIETLEEWNDILVGCQCCPVPWEPTVEMCHRRIKGTATFDVPVYDIFNKVVSGRKSWTMRFEGLDDWVQGHTMSFEGITTDVYTSSSPTYGVDHNIVNEISTDTVDPDPPTPPGSFWVAYDDDIITTSIDTLSSRLDSKMGVSMESVPVECEQTGGNYRPQGENSGVINAGIFKAKSWYCWRIPATFTGARVKLSWDVVTFPNNQEDRKKPADRTYLSWYPLHLQYENALAIHKQWEELNNSYAERHAEWATKKAAYDLWMEKSEKLDSWILAKAAFDSWVITSGLPQPPDPGPRPPDPGDRQLPGTEPQDVSGFEPSVPPEPAPYVGPGPSIQPFTTVWEGPGTSTNEYDESWRTEWFTLDPPASPGVSRITNVRVEYFRSVHIGSRPQISGEGFDTSTL